MGNRTIQERNHMLDRISLNGKRFSLKRETDQAGDYGSILISQDKNRHPVGENGEIIVGYYLECGSPFPRSFSTQDYWLTTEVQEIHPIDKKKVRIKTKNSWYIVESYELED